MPESQKPAPPTVLDQGGNRGMSHYATNRHILGSFAAITIAVLLGWHAVTGRNGISSWQQKRADNKALATEVDQLTEENARLSHHVDRLKSDPGTIEHEARARFGYARPNEIVYALTKSPKQK